jgi:phosphonopyruvate decarboxylase
MIEAGDFLGALGARGFDFFTGVPCSFLTPLINRVISDPRARYVGAASEGEAVAIAAGAWLAGRKPVVLCQNSGLGNTVNPLTSLNEPFHIPTLLITTWRGQPGLADEPQHELMGEITHELIETMRLPWANFPDSVAAIGPTLDQADAMMAESQRPFVLVMAKGSVADSPLDQAPAAAPGEGRWIDRRQGGPRPRRVEILQAMLEGVSDAAAIVATTGLCGRELYTLADRPQHLYQVGSMGGASAMGLGVALNTKRPVIVLDGDGAALMKMGNLATIGWQHPANLIHIVLDNGVHDSTGGQATVSAGVDFARVAVACGYARGIALDGRAAFAPSLAEALAEPGPSLLHVRLAPGGLDKVGRPKIKPHEAARRFKAFLAG